MSVSEVSFCRECHAPIVFVRTAKGKKMPCDSKRVDYVPDVEGSHQVLTYGGVLVSCFTIPEPFEGSEKGFIPHFWTCPARRKKIEEPDTQGSDLGSRAVAAKSGTVAASATSPDVAGDGAQAFPQRRGSVLSSREDEHLSRMEARKARKVERVLPDEFEQFSLFEQPVQLCFAEVAEE